MFGRGKQLSQFEYPQRPYKASSEMIPTQPSNVGLITHGRTHNHTWTPSHTRPMVVLAAEQLQVGNYNPAHNQPSLTIQVNNWRLVVVHMVSRAHV